MFHDKNTNNNINKLHESTLRKVSGYCILAFEEPLEKDNHLLFINYSILRTIRKK